MTSSRYAYFASCITLILWIYSTAFADTMVIGAYFPEWGVYDRNYHVTNIPAPFATHVFYAFAKPVYQAGSDTALIELIDPYAATNKSYPGDESDPFQGSFNQLLKLKSRFPHVKTLISLGGWTDSDDFSDIAASTNACATFAAACVTFVTNFHFDGIDLDWEYPVSGGEEGLTHRPEDKTNYVLLVRAIRNALDGLEASAGHDYLLTIAAGADPSLVSTRFAVSDLLGSIDWINLMTYDFAGSWDNRTGHLAPLDRNPLSPHPDLCVVHSVAAFTNEGAVPSQLVVGLPFYGRGFKGVSTTNNGLFQSAEGATDEGSWDPGYFDYRDLRDGERGHGWINRNGFTRYWDGAAGAPYLYNSTSFIFVTYEDSSSITIKTARVRQSGLRGIMAWSIDSDTGDNELLKAAYAGLYPQGTNAFSFQATALTNNVILRWTAPNTCGWSNQLVQIRFSTAGYPSNTADGTACYSGPDQVFEHNGLTPSQPYYYTIWASQDGVTFTNP